MPAPRVTRPARAAAVHRASDYGDRLTVLRQLGHERCQRFQDDARPKDHRLTRVIVPSQSEPTASASCWTPHDVRWSVPVRAGPLGGCSSDVAERTPVGAIRRVELRGVYRTPGTRQFTAVSRTAGRVVDGQALTCRRSTDSSLRIAGESNDRPQQFTLPCTRHVTHNDFVEMLLCRQLCCVS
jgi:hypothetical protein